MSSNSELNQPHQNAHKQRVMIGIATLLGMSMGIILGLALPSVLDISAGLALVIAPITGVIVAAVAAEVLLLRK